MDWSVKVPEGSTNPEEDAILIPGQGKEDVCPARKGKCGFAITSDHPNFELIANARLPTQDTEAFLAGGGMVQLPNVTDYHVPYQKAVMNSTSDFERVIHEPDTNESDGHGEAVKVGANMIMTGVVVRPLGCRDGRLQHASNMELEADHDSGQVHDRKQVRDRQL